ncbi:MAG TPA: TraB/GumN family protein, partial [Rhodanobacter sp.]|nr:TraB/GumN family protein [Rhodanobacter sp.]
LWKVSKDGHVLWVLGTLSPLPGHIQWESREVGQVLAQSKQVLLEPKIKLKADIGFFGKLFLLPSAYGARKNPDGKTLDQVMDAPTYARWQVLKKKYIGDDSGIERWRPLFAAQELYKKALKANGLSNDGGVSGAVAALAKQDGVPETPVEYRVEIKQPREALKAFKAAAPSDLECFNRTLDSIEHDVPAMTARANAWATGDLEELHRLPDSHRRDACVTAITSAGFARQLGLDDVPAQMQAVWLAAARKALADNATSFALLPMAELLSPTGYLARLRAEGYTVEAPVGLDEAPDAAGSAVPAVSSSAAAH